MKFGFSLAPVVLSCIAGITHAADTPSGGDKPEPRTLYLECQIIHGTEVVSAPKLLVRSGEKFKVGVGAQGLDSYSQEGTSTLGESDDVVTDFTYSNTHWTGPVMQNRRVAQVIRSGLGKNFMLTDIVGADGVVNTLIVRVSQPDASALKFSAQ